MKFNKIALVASAFAFAALGGCAESEQEAQEDLVEQQYEAGEDVLEELGVGLLEGEEAEVDGEEADAERPHVGREAVVPHLAAVVAIRHLG